MSVESTPVAGYGIYISDNLTELAVEILENKHDDDIESFLEEELKEGIEYHSIGNHFNGKIEYVLLVSNPLKDNRLEEFKNRLKENSNLFKDIKIVWICEVCIW